MTLSCSTYTLGFFSILKVKFSHPKLFFIKFPLDIWFTTLQGYFSFKRGQRIIFLYRSLIGVKANQYVKVVIYIYIYIFKTFFKLSPLVIKGLRVGMYQGQYGYHWERQKLLEPTNPQEHLLLLSEALYWYRPWCNLPLVMHLSTSRGGEARNKLGAWTQY